MSSVSPPSSVVIQLELADQTRAGSASILPDFKASAAHRAVFVIGIMPVASPLATAADEIRLHLTGLDPPRRDLQ